MKNRTKKVIAVIAIFVLIIGTIVFSNLDGSPKEPMFDNFNDHFFVGLLNKYKRDTVVVHSVDVYLKDGFHYYHAGISCLDPKQGTWTDKDLVYHGRSINDQHYFDLNATLTGDDANDANAYHEAVQQGEHRAFTAQEIKDSVDAFFNSAE